MGTGSQRKVRFYFDGEEILQSEIPTFAAPDNYYEKCSEQIDLNEVSFAIKLNWWNRLKLKYFLWKLFRKKKLILRAKSL